MEGQDQSPRILCRAREIGRNETSRAKMEFSWGKRNLHTRRTRAPPPWNTGMCEHLPPSASSFRLRLLVPQRRVCQQLQGATDGRIRYAAAAAAAPYVTRLPRFFRGISARGARSSRLHISEWGISLWREGGTRHDMRPCVHGGRKVAHIHHLHE